MKILVYFIGLVLALLVIIPSYASDNDFCQASEGRCLCLDDQGAKIYGLCRAWYQGYICDCKSVNHFHDCEDKEAGENCQCMKDTPYPLEGVCTKSLGKDDPHPRYKAGDVYCNCDVQARRQKDEL